MQLMRTSMRHLRLSKLQKDKLKQGKMWNFTVRGWRLADITGIEELFTESATATEPQKDITTITYEDTKIGEFSNKKICWHTLFAIYLFALSTPSVPNAHLLSLLKMSAHF